MVGAGVPITMVKDILGHSDIHTTMRYAHAITEQSLCTTTCSLININSKFEKVPQAGTEPM